MRTTAQGPRNPARTVFEVSLHTRNLILHVRGRADKGLGTQVPRRNRFGSAFTYAEFEFACPWACGQEPMDPGAQTEVFLIFCCIPGIPFGHESVHGNASVSAPSPRKTRKIVRKTKNTVFLCVFSALRNDRFGSAQATESHTRPPTTPHGIAISSFWVSSFLGS